jgi:amidohydrolase
MTSELLSESEDLLAEAVLLRRELHQHPELGLHNTRTQERLLDSLDGLGLEIKTNSNCSGIMAVLNGDNHGPTMLLRADMDALPLHEDADLPFKSTTEDTMHACGHDLHVSMLVGAAKMLHARRKEIKGRVVLMFQPGEEGYHGARYMIDDGLLNVAGPVGKAFAIHVTTVAPSGVVALKAGPIMASSDTLRIRILGRGGHASAPQHALDPIPIACEIVLALQTMITRRIDVFDPSVVTIAKIQSGTTTNTIRAVSERTRAEVHSSIKRVAEGIAGAHEGAAEVEIELGYPVTVNSDSVAADVMRVSDGLFGAKRVMPMKSPVMGSEDWSYVLQNVPGAMAFLGATAHGQDPFKAAPNHSNLVHFDEPTMSTGIALYTAMALDYLK